MTRNIKRELFVFSPSDYFMLKEHFEEMAKKGWMLEKIGYLTAKYRKTEPQDLIFSVDIYPELSYFKATDKKDIKSYINLCEEAGWKYITSSNNLQVFCSKKEDNLVPVQTDDTIKEKIVEKSVFMELLSMFISLLIVFNSLRKSIPFDYNMLFINTELALNIFLPIFVSYIFIFIFSHLSWIIRAKYNIKRNRELPKRNYILAKFKGISVSILSIFIIVTFILALIVDSITTSAPLFWFIIPIILIPVIAFIYQKKIKEMNISNFKKVSIVIIMVILAQGSSIILAFGSTNYNHNKELEHGYIGFTVKDFNIENNSYRKIFRKEGSILVSKKSKYREYYSDYSLGTIYIKSINSKIAKYIFDGMVKESVLKYNKIITPTGKEYEYFDEAFYINLPNPDKDANNVVIILKDNEILYLDGKLDLSNEDNIKVIINKLNNN